MVALTDLHESADDEVLEEAQSNTQNMARKEVWNQSSEKKKKK